MRIVLFESERDVVELIQGRCQRSGVRCDLFTRADELFELVRSEPESIDVVLISREMAGDEEAGFKLAQRLREDTRASEVPLILFSGVLRSGDFAKHQRGPFGANAYLKKPLQIPNLIQTVESVTGLKFPVEKLGSVAKAPLQRPAPASVHVNLVEASTVVHMNHRIHGASSWAEPLVLLPRFKKLAPVTSEEISGSSFVAQEAESSLKKQEVFEPATQLPVPAEMSVMSPLTEVSVEMEVPQGTSEGVNESIEMASTNALQEGVQGEMAAPLPPEVPSSTPIVEIPLSSSEAPLEMDLTPGATSSASSPSAPQSEGGTADASLTSSVASGAAPSWSSPAPKSSEDLGIDSEAARQLSYLFENKSEGQNDSDLAAEKNRTRVGEFPTDQQNEISASSSTGSEQPVQSGFVASRTEEHSGDIETLKRYLAMREQDAAILAAQLSYAKDELSKSEDQIKRLYVKIDDFQHKVDERSKRVETLEQQLTHIEKTHAADSEQMKFELKSKVDRIKYLEDTGAQTAIQYEKLKDRVRQDIRKIRAREKELENKLEILKKDSETLIAARESKILELKRKIDLIEFNYDTLQDQVSEERTNVAKAHEKIAKVVKVLKLAIGIIEGEAEGQDHLKGDDLGTESSVGVA